MYFDSYKCVSVCLSVQLKAPKLCDPSKNVDPIAGWSDLNDITEPITPTYLAKIFQSDEFYSELLRFCHPTESQDQN